MGGQMIDNVFAQVCEHIFQQQVAHMPRIPHPSEYVVLMSHDTALDWATEVRNSPIRSVALPRVIEVPDMPRGRWRLLTLVVDGYEMQPSDMLAGRPR
jgi:hypothetical protein